MPYVTLLLALQILDVIPPAFKPLIHMQFLLLNHSFFELHPVQLLQLLPENKYWMCRLK